MATIVYGIPVDDPALGLQVKKVLNISFVLVFMGLLHGVMMLAAAADVFGVVVAGYTVAVPLCGYFGAKNKDKNLLCCFCASNVVGAVFMGIFIGYIYYLFIVIPPTFYISIALGVLQFILYIYAACLASTLRNNPIFNVVVVQQQVVTATAVVAQPAVAVAVAQPVQGVAVVQKA